jgi:hypothetical protein
MAIPTPSTMTTEDTLPTLEEVKFTIGDPRWVMESLSDLYSNREGAVVREYSTNAYDEHVKFKVERPIEVSLPTMLDPYFRVRDFANGMSREVLTETYTQFGTSTKRDSNDYNGILGFGSKSAIAYTTSFKVTSWHDGIKTIAMIYKNDDGYIVLKVIAQTKSDEPSGVEVEVPVHNWQEFAHKAMDFFKFWLPGRVLVDGEEPAHAVGEKITEGLYYSTLGDTSYVVMGNVAYRIANPAALFMNTGMRQIHFVAYVDNGAVHFTPSREDLKYTDLTKATLHKVIDDFAVRIKSQAQDEIDNAKDHFDAYSKYMEWCNRLGGGIFNGLTFHGDELKNTFEIKAHRYEVKDYRSRNNMYRVDEWQVAWSKNTLFVTDITSEVTSNHKRRGKDWASFKGMPRPNYILFVRDSKVNSPWVPKENIVSWNTIKKELPRNYGVTSTGAPARIPGSFDIITKNGREYEKHIPDDGDVFYVMTDTARDRRGTIVNALNVLDNDGTVIILGYNRLNKFKRENPDIEEFFTWAAKHVEKDATKFLSDDAKRALDIGSNTEFWVGRMDHNKIDDPDWQETKALLKRKSELLKEYRDAISLAESLGVVYSIKTYSGKGDDSLLKKYPLLKEFGRYNLPGSDIYLYMNAAYAARKDA